MPSFLDIKRKSGPAITRTALPTIEHRTWRLNATKNALLITYLKILVKGNKHYCAPRTDTALDLLKRFHQIEIKPRWFYQCVHDLIYLGLVTRRRRPIPMPDNTIRSIPALVSITLKGGKYLRQKAVEGSKALVAAIIAWVHRDDHRFPGPSDILPEEKLMERSAALARLQELIEKIGSGPAGGRTPAPL